MSARRLDSGRSGRPRPRRPLGSGGLHRPRPARAGSGFTLLEVMVALAVLAAALTAIADLCGNALRNHVYARDLAEATLLARGKMAELEQKYEDEGFKDFDQTDEGDFAEAARPDVRWRVDLLRPSADLSADQLFSVLSGAGGDAQDLISKLMGGGAGSAGTSAPSSGAPQPTTATGGLAAGALGKMIQAQVTVFGETLKKSFREMRLTVSWQDGKVVHGFTVTTHLVVLNPRAPGGARGDNPEVPPNLRPVASGAGAGGLVGAGGLLGAGGVPGAAGNVAGAIGGLPGASGLGPAFPAFGSPVGGDSGETRRRPGRRR